jgi:predicted amidophosphoribosyltransferase
MAIGSPPPRAPAAGDRFHLHGGMHYALPTSKGETLRCVRCGTDNRPDRKFCAGCGAPLALR